MQKGILERELGHHDSHCPCSTPCLSTVSLLIRLKALAHSLCQITKRFDLEPATRPQARLFPVLYEAWKRGTDLASLWTKCFQASHSRTGRLQPCCISAPAGHFPANQLLQFPTVLQRLRLSAQTHRALHGLGRVTALTHPQHPALAANATSPSGPAFSFHVSDKRFALAVIVPAPSGIRLCVVFRAGPRERLV